MNIDSEQPVSGAIIGDAGSGKTHFALATKNLKTLTMLAEKQGAVTASIVKRMGVMHPESRIIRVQNWKEVMEFQKELPNNIKGFHMLIIDTGDEIERMIKRHYLGEKKILTYRQANDWYDTRNIVKEKLVQFLEWFRDLPIHKWMLVHPGTEKVSGDELKTVFGFECPEVSTEFAEKLNLIGHMERLDMGNGKIDFQVQFRGNSSRLLKSVPWFDDYETADIEYIMRKYHEFFTPAQPAQKAE